MCLNWRAGVSCSWGADEDSARVGATHLVSRARSLQISIGSSSFVSSYTIMQFVLLSKIEMPIESFFRWTDTIFCVTSQPSLVAHPIIRVIIFFDKAAV